MSEHSFDSTVSNTISPVILNHGQEDSFTNRLSQKKFSGEFNGFNVTVNNKDEMSSVYAMGCFGKGSLSRSYPCFHDKKGDSPKIICNAQWERRKTWFQMLSESKIYNIVKNNECNNQDVNQPFDESQKEVEKSDKDSNMVIIMEDVNNPNEHEKLTLRVEKEPIDLIQEKLHLALEEAFFLSYALNSLNICYKNELLSLERMWKLFKNSQSNFIDHYVAYHYFRAKGWIVKPGLVYGGDFLLYKDGPIFYHASYIVVVKRILDPTIDQNFSWRHLLALNRVGETANKIIVICEIWRPNDFDEDDVTQLTRCKVSEVILNRWVASENREEK